MPYTSFAVAGAGPTIGGRIVKALITDPRPNPLLQGAKIANVNYADVPGVSTVLRDNNVEVLISALSFAALQAQIPLAEAAQAVSVKLLVPSEFGMPSEGATDGVLAIKSQFVAYAKSLGIPVLRVYCGMFMEFIPWLTGVELGKFHLLGQQNMPASFTSLDDVSGFVAHALTTFPSSSLHDATYRIEGDRTSLEDIGALYEGRDPPVPAVHVDKLPDGFDKQTFLQAKFAEGRISAGWDNYLNKDVPENAASGTKAWEGRHWKTVKEVLGF
ncbi:hypothetical protein F5J12DRAFT_890410 [Pisolithus orientalis]|uniref:uncharacterized protein n=1 Tax=Pisolithus orientalis TaxID=936130 RepID=UPI0022242B20|nr:uncharacterized protein F5J12DRAFT_890410 [Pisolithus orientalis]KAI6015050.1 hypothetical protein F5J12DRAFT_890410 [Pisolithus orientalis]